MTAKLFSMAYDISHYFDKDINYLISHSILFAGGCKKFGSEHYSTIFGKWINHFLPQGVENVTGRMEDWRYIKRRLITLIKLELLHYEHKLGEIGGKSNQAYVGKRTLELRKQQNERNEKYLETYGIQTPTGFVSIADLSQDASKKFAELYMMCLGFEEIAIDKGYDSLFVTLTVPPHMHPAPNKGKNTWSGCNIKEAHQYLIEKWNALTKDLSREKYGVKLKNGDTFGFRVVEPHLDGTPHWHILFYADMQTLKEIIAPLLLKHFAHSDSAVEFRWQNEEELSNGKKSAKATSYMTKYLMKSLALKEAPNNKSAVDKAVRDNSKCLAIDAWKSALGIRMFQKFGIPAVTTKWQLIRKLRNQFYRGDLTVKKEENKEKIKKHIEDRRYGKLFRLMNSVDNKKPNSNEKRVFADFIASLDELKEFTENIYIKEKMKNRYGEDKTKIVGLDFGLLKFYFKKYEVCTKGSINSPKPIYIEQLLPKGTALKINAYDVIADVEKKSGSITGNKYQIACVLTKMQFTSELLEHLKLKAA